MQSVAIVASLLAGAVGVWFGLVEDLEFAFALGFIALAAGALAAFKGGFGMPPAELVPEDAKMDIGTVAYMTVIVGGLAAGVVGMWFGLVEDLKFAFALGLLAMVVSLLIAFAGKIPFVSSTEASTEAAAEPGQVGQSNQNAGLKTGIFLLGITATLLLGAGGVWYGLVEDIEILFFLGLVALSGSVLSTFRGTVAR